MTRLVGVTGSEVLLASPGVELTWDFAAEAELLGERFVGDVLLRVELAGGVVPDGGELQLGLGNDAPVVEAVLPPASEAAGNVAIDLRLSDSSADVVTLMAEWRRASDPPDAWRPATPAGVFPPGIATEPEGVDLTFFWDTATDLGASEQDVVVRFTPDDGTRDGAEPVGRGLPREGALRVDNNAAPIVQIDEAFLLTEDQVRGIPLSYRVLDAEGDPVRVVLQWRREDEADFPDLGTSDVAVLAELLRDPDFRREKQVCSPYARFARGRIEPVDTTRARLPELLEEGAWLLPGGIEGLELELLRPVARPTRLAQGWATNTMQRPVAALPLGDGRNALVLDAGSSSLVEVELATGAAVRTLASGWAGEPTAMCFTHDRRGVLISLEGPPAGSRLVRVDLASGTLVQLLDTSAAGPSAAIRGLIALSGRTALASAGDSLWRLEWIGTPGAVRVAAGLAEPWGLALDPVDRGRVLVAERAAAVDGGTGRIVSVELATGSVEPLVASHPLVGVPAFPGPTALAFQPGSRLLVALCEDGAGQRELRGLIEGRTPAETFSLGSVPAEAASLALGEASLSLLALPDAGDLAADGGIEQQRTIAAFERTSAEVTLTQPFVPPPRRQQAWRISQPDPFLQPRRGSPAGESRAFVWDSEEVPGGGRVRVRASCFDTELGVGFVTGLGKTLATPIEVDPIVLSVPGSTSFGALDVVPTELDGDGDLDLVVLQEGSRGLRLYLQEAPLEYSDPILIDGPECGRPSERVAQDIDGDGLLDIAVLSSAIAVYFQSSPGVFAAPLTLGDATLTSGPTALSVADLDGDGRLDVATTNAGGDDLTIFFQDSPRVFSSPFVLGGPVLTPGAQDLAAADLDADGDLDLAVMASNGLSLFRQDAARVFTLHSQIGGSGGTLEAHDLDADGDSDLVSNQSTSLVIYRLEGPFQFVETQITGSRLVGLEVADIDSDGDLDLVTIDGFRPGKVVVFLQEEGGFSTPMLLDEVSLSPDVSIALADLDGNGQLDVGLSTGNELLVYFQGLSGSFSRAVKLPGSSRFTLDAADIDGDGDADLLGFDPARLGLSIYPQLSTGFLRASSALPGPGFNDVLRQALAVDLEGDGDLDLVSMHTSSPTARTLRVYVQEAGAYTPTSELVLPPGTSVSFGRPPAPDLDGDGLRDLYLLTPSPELGLYFQASPGVFSGPVLVGPAADRPRLATVVDLDADGDLDLISFNETTSDLTVFFQTDPRQFDGRLRLGGPGITDGGVEAVDLEGDGDVDLLCTNSLGLILFRQEGPGSFAAPVGIAGLGLFQVVDLDADGALDIVDGSSVGFQTSDGSFEAPVLLAPGMTANSIADVDGDGHLDLVLSGFLQPDRILYQLAPRTFTAPMVLDPAAEGLFPSDLDADGDLDFIVRTLDPAVLFQLAPGRFSSLVPIEGFPIYDAADLDGDGDVDLVSRGNSPDQVLVQWGGR